MRSSSGESESGGSEDEYEVEYLRAAKWTGTCWEYKVHWYLYSVENETWEPEENLTDYGSAGLVDRFWREWPRKRHSRPAVGTRYPASRELLADERKRFLANRPKNEPVKGVDRSNKPVLIGDPESDDDDILAPTEDEDDEDILRPSSPEDAPIKKVSHIKSARTGSSTGARPKVLLKVTASAGKQPMVLPKSLPPRPLVSHSPIISTSSVPATEPYPPPAVKTNKVTKELPVRVRRRRRSSIREGTQPRSISKDFGGIDAKGKQAERAGEIMALGRRGSDAAGSAPVPDLINAYAGTLMRKASQGSGSNVPNTSKESGPNRIGSATPVGSPMEMSPEDMQQHRELPATELVDNLVNSVQAEIQPEVQSPRDSLFDGPSDDEAQPTPQTGLELDLGELAVNSPPRVPEPLPLEPQSEPPPVPLSTQPTIPVDMPLVSENLNNLSHAYTPSPLVQGLALQSPALAFQPLLPGQWHWTGDLFVTTQEPAAGTDDDLVENDKPKTQATHHRVCEVVIRDPALANENGTRVFASTLGLYIKDRITIQNTSDLHILYAEIAAGAFELTQAAWMVPADTSENADLDLWRGVLRKMETTIQGSIIKIYNANNAQMTRHLLLVPCTLVRKFRRLQPFIPVFEHFQSRTKGFAVLMCRRVQNMIEPPPRPFLAQRLPKHWQQIPPELHGQLHGVKCFVFPTPDSEPESGLLQAELAKCDAVIIGGCDRGGNADAIFVHRAWVRQLSGLMGLTHRRKRLSRRFYAFGSGGLWSAAEWDVREIWLIGGMVTFTPAALLEDPWVVNKVAETIQSNVTWHAYIEPKVVGTLTLRNPDDEVTFVLERVLDDVAFSSDFVPYPLALTSPPRRGSVEEFEWMHAQYALVDKSGEELRTACEEEAIDAYGKEIQPTQETASQVKPRGNENVGRGDGGHSSGAANARGNPPQTHIEWGLPKSDAPLHPSALQVDLSQIASDKRIGEMSDAVIEGLKTMQVQPCFMCEVRQFVVIDSKTRVKEHEDRVYKTEVEVITAEQFIAEFTENGLI
ncbi:hypothetical protein FRC08_010393 [Ceratobasidium sp. 394]|nr:hypothetical protein FRC08_010393 [Ceratobasidium sp. 394]